jgi:hypothetical protein
MRGRTMTKKGAINIRKRKDRTERTRIRKMMGK